jgi:hypothetical protein
MAVEGTKFQVNYKLNDGTLINLYAASVTELESGLADLAMNAANIRATGTELSGYAAPSAPTVESIAAQFNTSMGPVGVPAAAQEAPGAKVCKHGAMPYKEGVNAAGKAWRGYMCPAPRGATDKCEPIWVR